MNKFKNEYEVKFKSGKVILLRPEFQNIANIESNVANLSYLAYKISQAGLNKDLSKSISLTDCAKIIYFSQANEKVDRPGEKEYNLEEIWDMVSSEGISIGNQIIIYVSKIAAGNKFEPELSDNVKKN